MFLRFIHVILDNELAVCYFSQLSNILLYSHHTFCLSIHQMMDLDSLWIVYSIFWIVYCESAMNICLILEWTQFFFTTLLGCYWYTINHTNLNYTIWWILMYVYTPETIMQIKIMSIYITPHVSLCSSLWNPFLLPPAKPSSGNHGSAVTID